MDGWMDVKAGWIAYSNQKLIKKNLSSFLFESILPGILISNIPILAHTVNVRKPNVRLLDDAEIRTNSCSV